MKSIKVTNAVWFSRHSPTTSQIEEAIGMGYQINPTERGTFLGSMSLQNDADVRACITGLLAHCAETNAHAIFGVFSTPFLAQIARTSDLIYRRGGIYLPNDGEGDYPCFASWNIMRSPEGGKPTFEHYKWLGIGRINQESCRWL